MANPQLLAASAWDGVARCWEVQPGPGDTVNAFGKFETKIDGPILSCAWAGDGKSIFLACADKTAKIWTLGTSQPPQTIAQHEAPIRHLQWIPEINLLCTGGWDKVISYWDTRQPNPALKVTLPERVYAMDCVHPLLVVGTANRHIVTYNLTNPSVVFKMAESPLRYQTRCVTCFPEKFDENNMGYAVGSIEGRVGINFIRDDSGKRSFAFKCHRSATDVTFAVNDITFNPRTGTFVTVGSDGAFNSWDKEARQRLKSGKALPQPITTCHYNSDGNLLAYAGSYDWSKGIDNYNRSIPPAIFVRRPPASDMDRRPKQK
eukprot:c18496_g1_i2.p1 GENE.c18496_g1_i2~~c18496_g1_i2.p1  ORF type:complete len:361 (+),score=74.25 c18496_g1_i2:131-1084(+)